MLASVDAAKAVGIALARMRDVDARMTVDATVMATAALLGGFVITGDVSDVEELGPHFPGVTVLST